MGESESISDNVESRCKEQGIDYYRFSPLLDNVVSVGETDLDTLFKMVLTAKKSIRDIRRTQNEAPPLHNKTPHLLAPPPKNETPPTFPSIEGAHGTTKNYGSMALNFRRLVMRFQHCSIANEKMMVRNKLKPARKT